MKLTVAIPCFGDVGFLPDLLASLEIVPAEEVLILDDGNPAPIEVDCKDPRVRIIRHFENRGVAAARNTLIREARGVLILFVDADVVAKSWSGELCESFAGDETLAAVTGRAYEDGSSAAANRWRKWFWPQDHGPHPMEVPYAYGLCCVWRRAALLELGGFDEHLRTHGEDIDLSFRATAEGSVIRHDPALSVEHRRRDTVPSLIRMVWNHSYFFSVMCRRYQHPLFSKALVNAVKWLPTTVYSSVVRHRDLRLAMISVPTCLVSIAGRLWALVTTGAKATR